MTAARHKAHNQALAAFTLVELSIVIIILSLLTAGGLAVGASMVERQSYIDTRKTIEQLDQSVRDYYQVWGRLPCVARMDLAPGTTDFGLELEPLNGCVAGTPTGGANASLRIVIGGQAVRIGMVPVRSLGLTDAAASDKYGNRILYAVTEGLTNSNFASTTGAIPIRDGANNDIITNAAYVLISHGRDRRGGRQYSGTGAVPIACGSTTKLDTQNCDWADAIFRDAPFNNGSQDAFFFDDLIRWTPKSHIQSLETQSSALWATSASNDNIYSVGLDENTTTGNVGIGITSPRARLDVEGGIRAATNVPNSGNTTSRGYAFADDGDTGMFRLGGGTSDGASLSFYNDNTERMRIANNGFVAIGTAATPRSRLDVNGGYRAAKDAPSGDGSNVGYAFADDGDTGMFRVGSSTSCCSDLIFTNDNEERLRISYGGDIIFYNDAQVERMRITNNGYTYSRPYCVRQSQSSSTRTATASCGSNQYVMSGGGFCNNTTSNLTASYPDSSLTNWTAECRSGTSAIAYAICCRIP